MAAFKEAFNAELSKIPKHISVQNAAINISEEAFQRMKDDPAYKEQMLGLIKRDLGSSYAPNVCSLEININGTFDEYTATSYPVKADAEFWERTRDSAYKWSQSFWDELCLNRLGLNEEDFEHLREDDKV